MNFNGKQILFLLNTLVCLSQCKRIDLYDQSWHEGQHVIIDLKEGECLNLKDVGMEYSLTSIDTNDHCVYLHDRTECRGDRLRVALLTPCHWNIGACGNDFHERARSIILC